jgi:hypothetical protein
MSDVAVNKLTIGTSPVNNEDAATKAYVDAHADNFDLSDRMAKGTASGSVIEGDLLMVTNSGVCAHVEGSQNTALSSFAHAEGCGNRATGQSTHVEGERNDARGKYSHAEGYTTYASHESQHVFGEFNIHDPSSAAATARGNYVEIVGNGTAYNHLSNARTLDWSGNETLAGSLTLGAGTADEATITAAQLGQLVAALPILSATGVNF